MPKKFTHLCLPVRSMADTFYPDAYSVSVDDLRKLKPLVEAALRVRETLHGLRHIEVDWTRGTWLTIDGETADIDTFQEQDPTEAGWAADYNDDPDLPPLDGFAAQTDGNYIEFRCYDADTGLYSWSEPIYLLGDTVACGSLVCNLLTGEVTEVSDEQ